VSPELHYKDAILDRLAKTANVAQFVSFGPGAEPKLRYARVFGAPTHSWKPAPSEAVQTLLSRSVEGSVNVRSFHPKQPKANEFIYGLKSASDVMSAVVRLAGSGLFTIVNETVDVNDGGVSGVSYADIIEFTPGDTPRGVEKAGTVSMGRAHGLRVLETVYGFKPCLDYDPEWRVEFSIHPLTRGVRRQHTIIWEAERTERTYLSAKLNWPNRFSRLLGDKAFGLLIADSLGLPVPRTTVIPRRLAPFSFGKSTQAGEYWIRTCPIEQVPGKFTTQRGWIDPFLLMATEDPSGEAIASVLAQEGVEAAYSGAAIADNDGRLRVEGVVGFGDEFMQGSAAPTELPTRVTEDVARTYRKAAVDLGPVRFEWVRDRRRLWIVQLHRGPTESIGATIYPGRALVEHRFEVSEGLDALRALVAELNPEVDGVVLIGEVGVTSHFGDVLRRAHMPSRIENR
jgi:hypothetical protein